MVLKLAVVLFVFIFIRLLLETLVFFEQNINLNKEEYSYKKVIKSIKYLEFKNLFFETFKPRSKRNYSEYIHNALIKEFEIQNELTEELEKECSICSEEIFKVKTVYNFEKKMALSLILNDTELNKTKIIIKSMKKWTGSFKFKEVGISLKKVLA